MDKLDIKIFVSHRIDLKSSTVENPLYVNVRCGAIFDERKNIDLLGDDTGDNISNRRNSFNELTVQYWAWKNQDADYYGLCHYRRYLVFSEDKHTNYNFVHQLEEPYLSKESVKKYGIDNEGRMRNVIMGYDMVLPEYVDISKRKTPMGYKKSVREHWEAWDKHMIDKDNIEMMLCYIKEYDLNIYISAMEYLEDNKYRGYNCFVMKKNWFKIFCEFEFYVLNKINERIEYKNYSEKKTRSIGFLGEILFGIFCYYAETKMNARTKSVPIVFFSDTSEYKNIHPLTKTKSIPIVLVSSQYFIPYVACFIQSLIQTSNPQKIYDIIILFKEISEDIREKVQRIVENIENISVRFFNSKILVSERKFKVANVHVTEESYYRMLVPWILTEYSKAIVMDSDIILNDDVANLYNENIDGYLMGAVQDVVWQGYININSEAKRYSLQDMKLKDPYSYVNTGVVLMNLDEIRRNFSLEYMLDFMEEHPMRIQEQDIINMLFEGKIKFLDIKYNAYLKTNSWVKDNLMNAPVSSLEKYREGLKKPSLIHYANIPKPWDNPEIEQAERFWEMARKTPFYEVILQRMWDKKLQETKETMLREIQSLKSIVQEITIHNEDDIYDRFIFPWNAVEPGSNIIIYGGGVVGKTFLKQLAKNSYCHVVAVCDKTPEKTRIIEAPVIGLQGLMSMNDDLYDIILIAIERKDIAIEIRTELIFMGISRNKIKWIDPARS